MKKDKSDRFPVPEDSVERFMGVVHSIVESFGIDKIPDVMHYVELLDQAVDRHLFNSIHKVSPHKKEDEKKRRFIAIFEQRYLHSTDLDYSRPISPQDAKMIVQTVAKIEGKGFTIDEFLQWLFEVFLPDEPKMNPPAIHFSCTNFVVEKFLYQNREKIKQRQEEEVKKKDALDVIARARAVMRMYREVGNEDEAQVIVTLLRKYGKEGTIPLDDVRKAVEQSELSFKNNTVEQDQGGEDDGEEVGESGCADDDGQSLSNVG